MIFFGRFYFTSNDGSQNPFVFQPGVDDLELKIDKDTGKLLYTALLHSVKFSEYRTGIKFDEDPLAVEQSN